MTPKEKAHEILNSFEDLEEISKKLDEEVNQYMQEDFDFFAKYHKD